MAAAAAGPCAHPLPGATLALVACQWAAGPGHWQPHCQPAQWRVRTGSGMPLRVGGSRRRGRCAAIELAQLRDPNAAPSPSARAHQRERRPAGSKVGLPSHGSSCASHVARLPATLSRSYKSLLAASRRCIRACGAARTARGPHAQAPGPRRDTAVASRSVRVAPTAGERRRLGRLLRVGRLAGTGGGEARTGPARPSG